MEGTPNGRETPVSLDDLIALNEEIAALAGAGVPLERGLADFGRDMPGVSGRLATRLAERLQQGNSLAAAIEEEGNTLPPVYRATVLAGLRSGDLTAALEGLTETAQRVAETRRIVGMAVLYPLIVVIVGWLLLGFTVVAILPVFDWLDVARRGWMPLLALAESTALWWTFLVPAALVIGALIWWLRSNRVTLISLPKGGRTRFPTLGGIRRLGQAATLAEVLALLIDRRTPLDDALLLAADTAGMSAWRESADALAAQIRRGQPLSNATCDLDKLPPLIRLALLHIGGLEPIADGLRSAGATYRERARHGAEWLAMTLPTLLTVTVGGTAVAAYAAVVFWPYLFTLHEMSGW